VSGVIAGGPGWGLLHDPALVGDPRRDWFAAEAWEKRMTGHAGRGRGRVRFVMAGDAQWALRHYRRGGLVGRLVSDRYAWLGAERTRAFREWRLLAHLHAAGLPVPRPVAAGWTREGLFYSADLATVLIPGAMPLSARIAAGADIDWRRIGQVLQDFHAAGAFHADLNAHNILLDAEGEPWLLDFDRGRLRPPGAWQARNLERLRRSLEKIAREPSAPPFSAPAWAELLSSYDARRDLRFRARRP